MDPQTTPDIVSWPQGPHTQWQATAHTKETPRNITYINNLKANPNLQPKEYSIAGTHGESKILFTDVKILDSTGREPYNGDVLIEGGSGT